MTELSGDFLEDEDEFPGSIHPSPRTNLAEKVWEWIKRAIKLLRQFVKKFHNWNFSPKSGTGSKRGRPTISDSDLISGRNHWCAFFENAWPEIGWTLQKIRNRRTSTIEDIRNAFEPLREKPHSDAALVFLRGTPEKATTGQLRENRIRDNELWYKIQNAERELPTLKLSRAQAENALNESSEENKSAIQEQLTLRRSCLELHEENLKSMRNEVRELDKKTQNQEAFIYCSELLDFLLSRRRAIEPRKLGKALAGVPFMKWRQSDDRCPEFDDNHYVQYPYQIFQAVSRICDRTNGQPSIDLCEKELLELPKEFRSTRENMCRAWRDLKLSIIECVRAKYESGFMPYAISSAFLRNVNRMKKPEDLVLDEHERLPP